MLKVLLLFSALSIGLCYATSSTCQSVHQSQLASLNERMNQMISALYSSFAETRPTMRKKVIQSLAPLLRAVQSTTTSAPSDATPTTSTGPPTSTEFPPTSSTTTFDPSTHSYLYPQVIFVPPSTSPPLTNPPPAVAAPTTTAPNPYYSFETPPFEYSTASPVPRPYGYEHLYPQYGPTGSAYSPFCASYPPPYPVNPHEYPPPSYNPYPPPPTSLPGYPPAPAYPVTPGYPPAPSYPPPPTYATGPFPMAPLSYPTALTPYPQIPASYPTEPRSNPPVPTSYQTRPSYPPQYQPGYPPASSGPPPYPKHPERRYS